MQTTIKICRLNQQGNKYSKNKELIVVEKPGKIVNGANLQNFNKLTDIPDADKNSVQDRCLKDSTGYCKKIRAGHW